MKNFFRVAEGIRSFLAENSNSPIVTQAHEQCLEQLETYFRWKGCDYTPKMANSWFEWRSPQMGTSERYYCKTTLIRLQDIYEYSQVRPEHISTMYKAYLALDSSLRRELDLFLNDHIRNIVAGSARTCIHSCSRFLLYAQVSGCSTVGDITYDTMFAFYLSEKGTPAFRVDHSQISLMMEFFFKQNMVPYGFTRFYHFLAEGNECFWNEISPEIYEKIKTISCSSATLPVSEILYEKEVLTQIYRDAGYSNCIIVAMQRTIDLLILFLDMNGYRYNYDISMCWLEGRSSFLPYGTVNSYRHTLCQLHNHLQGLFNITQICRTTTSGFNRLPSWCHDAAEQYVAMKENEGWSKSTLDMIRVSICKFCNYLDNIGIRSFEDVKADHIKQFNAADIHKTPQGKNAYNSRIRKFLFFLGEKGFLTNPMIFVALAHVNAPKETIVVVLTQEEMNQLSTHLHDENGSLTLRQKAMLLLGLKMGIRASDIVNLKWDDVNWETASIRFVQKKTAVEVELPMPNEVGNALFRYITEERGQNPSPSIFLSSRAPHSSVGGIVCWKALKAALPERNVPGSGFHVTRKTYATDLLRNGVGTDMVAEALGQSGTASVNRYLSLDENRMRTCSLSLQNYGIGGWTGGR